FHCIRPTLWTLHSVTNTKTISLTRTRMTRWKIERDNAVFRQFTIRVAEEWRIRIWIIFCFLNCLSVIHAIFKILVHPLNLGFQLLFHRSLSRRLLNTFEHTRQFRFVTLEFIHSICQVSTQTLSLLKRLSWIFL